jgi:hypothetical protein
MPTKGKVYGVTVTQAKTQAEISQFAALRNVKEATAVKLIVERYFMLSYEQREALEKKVQWRAHRNRTFRSLTRFFPKVKA